MKIDELIREINKYDFLYAQTNSERFPDDIVISIKDGINRLPLIVFPKDELNSNDCCFYTENLHNNIGPMTLRNILNMVAEYVSTPIDERFPEKKYRLVVNSNSLEQTGTYATKYVACIEESMDSFSFVYGGPTVFSERDLKDIEKRYPNIAPAIEDMKEEVKDDK